MQTAGGGAARAASRWNDGGRAGESAGWDRSRNEPETEWDESHGYHS